MAYQNWLCFDNAGHVQTILYRFFHSTSHQKHPCSTFAIFFFLRNKMLNYLFACACQKEKLFLIARNIFSIKTKCRFFHCRKTHEIQNKKNILKKKKKHIFRLFLTIWHFFSLFVHCFHVFSFLLNSLHFLHFPSLEKTSANPDHLHVDPLLSFADIRHNYVIWFQWSKNVVN